MNCELPLSPIISSFQSHDLKGSMMNFNQPGFLEVEKKRPAYLLHMLRQNSKIIYTDIDTIWLRDPRPSLTGNFDFWGQIDGLLEGQR